MKLMLSNLFMGLLVLPVTTIGTIFRIELIDNIDAHSARRLENHKIIKANLYSSIFISLITEALDKAGTENKYDIWTSNNEGHVSYGKSVIKKGVLQIKGIENINELIKISENEPQNSFLKSKTNVEFHVNNKRLTSYIMLICDVTIENKTNPDFNIQNTTGCYMGIEFVLEQKTEDGNICLELLIRAFDNMGETEMRVTANDNPVVKDEQEQPIGIDKEISDFISETAAEFMNRHLQIYNDFKNVMKDLGEGLIHVLTATTIVEFQDLTDKSEIKFVHIENVENNQEYTAIIPNIDSLFTNEIGEYNDKEKYLIIPLVTHMPPLAITVYMRNHEIKVVYTTNYYTTSDIFVSATRPLLVKGVTQRVKDIFDEMLIPLNKLENNGSLDNDKTTINLGTEFTDEIAKYNKKTVTAGSLSSSVNSESTNKEEYFEIKGLMTNVPEYMKQYPNSSLFNMSIFVKEYARLLSKHKDYMNTIKTDLFPRKIDLYPNVFKYSPMILWPTNLTPEMYYINEDIYLMYLSLEHVKSNEICNLSIEKALYKFRENENLFTKTTLAESNGVEIEILKVVEFTCNEKKSELIDRLLFI